MSIWSSVIQGAGNLLGGLFGNNSQKKQREHEQNINNQNIAFQQQQNQQNLDHQSHWNEQNINFQQQTNKENRDFTTEMWNKTNAYNSPEAMMQRFKDAGINPYTVATQGGQATQGSYSGSAPQGKAYQGTAPRAEAGQQMYNSSIEAEAIKSFANIGTSYLQNKLTSQQVATQQAQIRKLDLDALGTELDNFNKQISNNYLEPSLKQHLKKGMEDIMYTQAKNQNLKVENEYQELKLKSELNISEANLQQIKQTTQLTSANTDHAIAQTKKLNALLPLELQQYGLNFTLIGEQIKQGKLNQEQARLQIKNLIHNEPAIQAEAGKRQGDAQFQNKDWIRTTNFILEKIGDVVGIGGNVIKGFKTAKPQKDVTINNNY